MRHKIGGLSKPTLASQVAVQFERSTESLCQHFQNQGRSSLGSMEDTLLIGDHLLVDKLAYAPAGTVSTYLLPYEEPKHGDIIVFYKPTLEANGEHLFLVKRVMGLPGDHLHLRAGIVYRNGVALDEPYAGKPTDFDYQAYRDDFPSVSPYSSGEVTAEWAEALPGYIQGQDLVVPPGMYFAMGDNRTVSLDSRYWGFVPRANIVGRPLFVYWSFETPESEQDKTSMGDRIGWILHETIHFFDGTRWSRTFHRVK